MGWILITLASFCAFMVGLNYGRREQFKAIEATISVMLGIIPKYQKTFFIILQEKVSGIPPFS